MSMNEFERPLNEREDAFTSFSAQERVVPTDFSEEDIAFAQDLDALFALDEEQVSLYFVQKLLESDDPCFQVVERGFEHKTRARVFRRLNLRRRLFHQHQPWLTRATSSSLRRPLVALMVCCLLFMLCTMAFTSQSFAEGMALLLHGARSGVYQVETYPNGIRSASPGQNDTQPRQISLLDVQRDLHFPIYWPQVPLNTYVLDNIYLYQQPQQAWADGPILELHYDYISSRTAHGSGEIAIREFKPKGDVLQVVESGAAHAIQVDTKGHAQAIYVDGQWVSLRYTRHWVYSGRSELIYQQDGVVYWIVGDQRDGMDENALLKLAQSLQVVNIGHVRQVEVEMADLVQLVDDTSELFTGDVLAVFPDDGGDSPYLSLAGPDQPSQEEPIERHRTHSS